MPAVSETGVQTWEFLEFGFSAKMLDGEETLDFRAIQTYSGGEVVRWTGAPDSEAPAALLATYDLGLEEGQGELALLAELTAGSPDAGDDGGTVAEDEGVETGTIISGIALVLALIALALAMRGRPGAPTP